MRIYRIILSLVLAAAMLVAGIGVTVNFHLCAGKVRTVAINVKADGCHDEQSCHAAHAEKKRGCCSEKTFVFKGKDSTAAVKSVFKSTASFKFTMAVLPLLQDLTLAPFAGTATENHISYKPPLLHRTSPAFLQSFLI